MIGWVCRRWREVMCVSLWVWLCVVCSPAPRRRPWCQTRCVVVTLGLWRRFLYPNVFVGVDDVFVFVGSFSRRRISMWRKAALQGWWPMTTSPSSPFQVTSCVLMIRGGGCEQTLLWGKSVQLDSVILPHRFKSLNELDLLVCSLPVKSQVKWLFEVEAAWRTSLRP